MEFDRSPAPTLSVVVPVHGVQGYLRQCLDSLLVQDAEGLELIAVDDASPDGCGAILDEYAARDRRVRVVHLDDNVGLGEARNVGLELARGDYLWFFDSDDYATEGAVPAILARLAATEPDVLLFDYARSYWTGRFERNKMNRLFREPPAPDVFSPVDRPSVLELMMTAWNRAIRRELLLELGLRFSGGYYEDLNVTYPVLMAAERVSLLDRVCYVYRQRRRGAITRTTGRRHFDVFAQYERVFAFMDRTPATEPFRALMFDRALWHLLVILGKRDRLPDEDRPAFFAKVARFYRSHRPEGHVTADDPAVAAVAAGDHDAYRRALDRADARRRREARNRDLTRRVGRRTTRVKRRLKLGYYGVERRRCPVDEHLAVYAAYWNRGYSCNPAAIYEKARELAPDVRGVWVVRPDAAGERGGLPPGVEHVVAGSPAYYRLIARAKYFINNVNFPGHIVKRPGQVHLMTQHGTPLKVMGLDQRDYPVGAKGMHFGKLMRRSDRWDYLISSNPFSSEVWRRVFPCEYEMWEIGYPRNDRLVRSDDDERARLRTELGVPEGATAILYAPTHREYQRGYRPMFDIGRFVERLGPNVVLLLRAHYFYGDEDLADSIGPVHDQVVDVSGHPSVEDLAIASDVLLTDYSSVMFDYANLDRPIVVHVDDYDAYRRTRGVYFDLPATAPGVVTRTEDELADAFTSGAVWDDPAHAARADFRARFCPWDDGRAAERAVRGLFLGEKVKTPG
ncbi:bifunctional glycosyltransferase/CDP-glycerol:glycerophosphate glycerophosphotransferase [Actinomadura atramentaria]|uniref:bifunctional glycosyltransferase/CDP-glycerol:glycerophosphate glycerophosphotransferase n=1 Tax=Actinomadura atramentaria TaxID=1990 RepID=UPI0003769C3F|nr:bifunctional glycosyltransferase family 2 protein/CDP-glycerol:glycerophosphate glycerophosphotransferase [Actinomadura atramentaria]